MTSNLSDRDQITEWYKKELDDLLRLLNRVSDEQFFWRPNPSAHNIAYEVWHLARWADHLQSRFPDMTPELLALFGPGREIWKDEKLGQKWGFKTGELGSDETGMEMEDAVAASLDFSRAELMAYTQKAFTKAIDAVARVPESQYPLINQHDTAITILGVVFSHMTHTSRHLGMIEAMLGMQGARGTATR